MLNKSVYFLSGLPRTGSTLLGSMLAQNPDVHVTPTSPLYPLLVNTNEQFNLLNVQYTFDCDGVSKRVYTSMIEAFYADMNRPIIFDKHRGWPKHCEAIREFINPRPRIICTVRPIAEIIASYITLAEKDKNNFIDKHLRKLGEKITSESRANLLWTHYIKSSYDSMKEGLEKHKENIMLVNYNDIVLSPQKTLDRIHNFCDIKSFSYKFESIENKCAEAKDEAWGLKNLHTIRPNLQKQSIDPLKYLPQAAVDYFGQFDTLNIL